MKRAVMLVCLAAACGGGAAHRRAGLDAAAAGRDAEAALTLRLALAERPGDAEARAALGLVLLRMDQPGGALRELEEAARDGAHAGQRELTDLRARRAALLAALRAPAADEPDLLETFAAHLRGESEDFPDDAARVRLLAVDPAELPPWSLPTRARIAGGPPDLAGARAALAGAPPRARLLVAVEGAIAGDAACADLIDGAGDLEQELAAATVARLLGRVDDERAALARAQGLPGGALALARRGDAAPVAELGASGARGLVAPPLPCRPDADALVALRRALDRDLGVADRLARAYVDGDVALACRVPQVAVELFRAGAGARALGFAEELVAESPDTPAPHFLTARILVALGDPARAALEITAAEASARRRGGAGAEVSAALRRAGRAIDAIAVARVALSVADPPERWSAFEALVTAALAAGREPDAHRAFDAYARELPAPLLPSAAGRIRAALGVVRPPPWLPPSPMNARLGPARVDDLVAAGDTRALLAIGLADESPRGARALEAYARLIDRPELARAARREAHWLTPPF